MLVELLHFVFMAAAIVVEEGFDAQVVAVIMLLVVDVVDCVDDVVDCVDDVVDCVDDVVVLLDPNESTEAADESVLLGSGAMTPEQPINIRTPRSSFLNTCTKPP